MQKSGFNGKKEMFASNLLLRSDGGSAKGFVREGVDWEKLLLMIYRGPLNFYHENFIANATEFCCAERFESVDE